MTFDEFDKMDRNERIDYVLENESGPWCSLYRKDKGEKSYFVSGDAVTEDEPCIMLEGDDVRTRTEMPRSEYYSVDAEECECPCETCPFRYSCDAVDMYVDGFASQMKLEECC